jgi:hypothetical protein
MNLSALVEVASCVGQYGFVDIKQSFEGVFMDMQVGQVRKEVVTDEDGNEYKVVDDSFEIIFEGKGGRKSLELEVEVFSE